MDERVVFIDGQYVPESEARISVFDHVVLYGDGVFETAVAWNGRIFRLEEHVDRLFKSMAAVGIEAPYSRKDLRELILETVRRNGLPNAYVKWLVTRGSNGTPLLDPRGCKASCIILVRPYLYMTSPERVQNGVRVKTVAIRRPPGDVLDAKVKSLNYLNLVLAKMEAVAAGADEALLLNTQGRVCEAPGYNVFVSTAGSLRTPAEDILEGITRDTVFEMASEMNLPCSAASLSLYDVYVADEVFLCSTAGGIIPVVQVDGRVIGAGVPGPVTRSITAAYMEILATDPRSAAVPGLVGVSTAAGAPLQAG